MKIVLSLVALASVFPGMAMAAEPDSILFMTRPDISIQYEQQKEREGTVARAVRSTGEMFQAGIQTIQREVHGLQQMVQPPPEPPVSTLRPVPGPQMMPNGPTWKTPPVMRNFAGQSYTPGAEAFRASGYGGISMTAYSSQIYSAALPPNAPLPPNVQAAIRPHRDALNPYEVSMDQFWQNTSTSPIPLGNFFSVDKK